MKSKSVLLYSVGLLWAVSGMIAQEVLPFQRPPSASVAGRTLQESQHQRRVVPNRLPKDAPNIVIFMIDDAGYGNADTFGGPVHTPTLSRLANEGIAYNRFHTTAMCSPTRASLLTGRNHHRVGAGQIAEFAADWDGYVGEIPRSTATMPQVLSYYGYDTAAFGKWHNTPVDVVTPMGPFDQWPLGLGFKYFYGFLAGETSQYAPVREHKPGGAAQRPQLRSNARYGREGYSLDANAADACSRKAVLRLVHPGRRAWSPAGGQKVGRQVQRQIRPGMGEAGGDEGHLHDGGDQGIECFHLVVGSTFQSTAPWSRLARR